MLRPGHSAIVKRIPIGRLSMRSGKPTCEHSDDDARHLSRVAPEVQQMAHAQILCGTWPENKDVRTRRTWKGHASFAASVAAKGLLSERMCGFFPIRLHHLRGPSIRLGPIVDVLNFAVELILGGVAPRSNASPRLGHKLFTFSKNGIPVCAAHFFP